MSAVVGVAIVSSQVSGGENDGNGAFLSTDDTNSAVLTWTLNGTSFPVTDQSGAPLTTVGELVAYAKAMGIDSDPGYLTVGYTLEIDGFQESFPSGLWFFGGFPLTQSTVAFGSGSLAQENMAIDSLAFLTQNFEFGPSDGEIGYVTLSGGSDIESMTTTLTMNFSINIGAFCGQTFTFGTNPFPNLCVQFCRTEISGGNVDVCAPFLTAYCGSLPFTGTDATFVDTCGCYLNQSIYDNFYNSLNQKLYIPPGIIHDNPACYFAPCQRSSLNPNQNYNCGDVTLVECVNIADISVGPDGTIEGNININEKSDCNVFTQRCTSDSDCAPGQRCDSGLCTSSSVPASKDTSVVVAIVVAVVVVVLVLVLVLMLRKR